MSRRLPTTGDENQIDRAEGLTGDIAPILDDYVGRGLIRVLDLLFVKRDEGGDCEAFEATDVEDSEVGEFRRFETQLATLLSEQDVQDLVETVEPGSSAAVLVWENLWAVPETLPTFITHRSTGSVPILSLRHHHEYAASPRRQTIGGPLPLETASA